MHVLTNLVTCSHCCLLYVCTYITTYVYIRIVVINCDLTFTGVEQAQLPDNHDQEQQSGVYTSTYVQIVTV